jgi:glycerol-3-phosphate dehydrogenase, anaerobic, B subunit
MGTLKPTWLTFSDFTPLSSANDTAGKKILVVNMAGFLDFNTKFVADSFEKYGAECRISSINLPELERLRISPTEMRSTNIARVLENEKTLEALILELTGKISGFDIVALPAVFGLSSAASVKKLKESLDIPVWLIPTMPPSVPGIRAQQQLRRSFEELGGVYMLGDTVVKADFSGNKVQAVYSVNHGDISFVAENFVLASGSYFSNGLVAQPDSVIEPVFGSDVDFTPGRDSWYDKAFFNKQNYMTFGVATDDKLRIKIKGDAQRNLFAIGSVLSGSNTIHEGCGAGISMLTALYVADNLIKG